MKNIDDSQSTSLNAASSTPKYDLSYILYQSVLSNLKSIPDIILSMKSKEIFARFIADFVDCFDILFLIIIVLRFRTTDLFKGIVNIVSNQNEPDNIELKCSP